MLINNINIVLDSTKLFRRFMMQNTSKLWYAIYQFPLLNEQVKNYQQLQARIDNVIFQLNNQLKLNVEEMERICKQNSKLYGVARLLRQHSVPKGIENGSYWKIICKIISMFTLMITSNKMIEFFNKLNIPFSIYRILIRAFNISGKFEFEKKKQVEEGFKFMLKMLQIKNNTFPRLFASLILNILNECSDKYTEKQYQQTMKNIITIGLQLTRFNLKLSAESGILSGLYKKAIDKDLNISASSALVEIVSQHMNTQDNRKLIFLNLDLCRAFAPFTNVDAKYKQGKNQLRTEKNAVMLELLLSSSSTLFYFLQEKVSLKNFVLSLKSKSKSERQLAIINEKIFKKLIDKVLRYDRNKMQRSNNAFGLYSNYLNYRALLILSYFLLTTQLFQIYLNTDPNGSLFAGLGKTSLMYFPITFETAQYNKKIIQTIKLPSASDYQKLNKDFLSILSYYDYCIIPYEFTKAELINFLLHIKNLDSYKTEIPQDHKNSIEDLLENVKMLENDDLLHQYFLDFYISVMQICQILPWHPIYLKLSKFLSLIIQYLRNICYIDIMNACLDIVSKIFTQPKPNFFKFLYITALDDAGKYFQDHEKLQQLIKSHYRNPAYAFSISRILLHTDLNKTDNLGIQTHKKLLENICDNGCQQLILQVIEIIRFYCIDYDDKTDWGTQLICEKLIYHSSEQIASAAVQFCQQFVANHRSHKSYLNKINLGNIKDNNLRKRIMYLFLSDVKGIDLLNSYNPNFIKDQIDLWVKEGHNQMKQLANFLAKQNKRFTGNKDTVFLDIGKVSQNRHQLIFLPWNVQINEKSYVSLASYKYLEEKIKLKISCQLLVQTKIQIVFLQIGGFKLLPKTTISVKKEEIIKYYEKNRKETKEIKKFAVFKENTTFYFKYDTGSLVLKKVVIDISLARDVYRSITYPLSFLTHMMKTGRGFAYLREQKFIQHCIQILSKIKENKDKDREHKSIIDIQLSKGAIECLGLLFASWKLEFHEKIDIYSTVHSVFDETENYELKQVALWVLNIIVKDDDMRRKLKQSKGWLTLQSKYCGYLCYPQFYQSGISERLKINQFSHISINMLPERPHLRNKQYKEQKSKQQKSKEEKSREEKGKEQKSTENEGYKLIVAYLEVIEKNEYDIEVLSIKKKQMLQFFKKPENKESVWDWKLYEKVVSYISVVNFGIRTTQEILDLFTTYFLNEKFDSDFPNGSILP